MGKRAVNKSLLEKLAQKISKKIEKELIAFGESSVEDKSESDVQIAAILSILEAQAKKGYLAYQAKSSKK